MPAFIRSSADAGMSDEERAHVVDVVSATPDAGELIVGTGGCRKLRVAGRGKGKSGGYRVVTYYYNAEAPVFLLWAYSKGDVANLTKAEKNALAKVTAALADSLRTVASG